MNKKDLIDLLAQDYLSVYLFLPVNALRICELGMRYRLLDI
jgi:hypothetical protein